MKYITWSARETSNLGRELAARLKGGEVVCLYGNLGSGKTTFISGVVNYFRPKTRVLSPTFIIVRHYRFDKAPIKNLFHADLYRLDNKSSIKSLGLVEYWADPHSVFLMEWADKMAGQLPEKRIDISFRITGRDRREIIYGKTDK